MPADSFINMLRTETGYENIVCAMPGGESRLANIRLLEKYAAEYEASWVQRQLLASCALRSA